MIGGFNQRKQFRNLKWFVQYSHLMGVRLRVDNMRQAIIRSRRNDAVQAWVIWIGKKRLDDLAAIHTRQHEIEQDDQRLSTGDQQCVCLKSIATFAYNIPRVCQCNMDDLTNIWLVVDHQDC